MKQFRLYAYTFNMLRTVHLGDGNFYNADIFL